jgi:hypothetical protein
VTPVGTCDGRRQVWQKQILQLCHQFETREKPLCRGLSRMKKTKTRTFIHSFHSGTFETFLRGQMRFRAAPTVERGKPSAGDVSWRSLEKH